MPGGTHPCVLILTIKKQMTNENVGLYLNMQDARRRVKMLYSTTKSGTGGHLIPNRVQRSVFSRRRLTKSYKLDFFFFKSYKLDFFVVEWMFVVPVNWVLRTRLDSHIVAINWTELNWTELNWTELNWTELFKLCVGFLLVFERWWSLPWNLEIKKFDRITTRLAPELETA